MSSELSSLTSAVTPDKPAGYGAALKATTSTTVISPEAVAQVSKQGTAKKQTEASQNTKQAKKEQQTNASSNPVEKNKQEEQENPVIGKMSASELREVLDEINGALYSYNRELKFELHEDTDDLVVKVFNTKTDEIIRQYPSEEVLRRKAKILEGATSFFSTQVF